MVSVEQKREVKKNFDRLSVSEPVERPPGIPHAHGPHVTYGKNFLGACRCMTVVVL